eukprot:551596-Prorocentrum_lima.AAC.1
MVCARVESVCGNRAVKPSFSSCICATTVLAISALHKLSCNGDAVKASTHSLLSSLVAANT